MFLSRNASFATKIGWQDQFILLVKAMSAQNVHIVLSCLNKMLSSFRRAATFFVILVFYWIKVAILQRFTLGFCSYQRLASFRSHAVSSLQNNCEAVFTLHACRNKPLVVTDNPHFRLLILIHKLVNKLHGSHMIALASLSID